jgi:type I restriction enzyme, S subunit
MSESPTAPIPESWAWSRIQDVATTATGGTPSRTVSEYFGGAIPWVKSGELGDGHVFESEETLSELGLKSSNAKLFPKGTPCIALYGATVGKLGILEVDAATNQAVCGMFLPKDVHRDFAFHYLASIRRHLIEQGKGGAQSNISNGLVRQTPIPIAPVNEQQRIVAKIEELFSDLDAGVAALKRAKANLKRCRAAVLKAAVEGNLTEAWRAEQVRSTAFRRSSLGGRGDDHTEDRLKPGLPTVEPASKLLARILTERRQKWEADQLAKFAAAKKEPPKNWREKYVEPTPADATGLPELPEGWCWATIEQVAIVDVGFAFKSAEFSNEGIRLLRGENMEPGKLRWNDVRHWPKAKLAEFEHLLVQEGQIILAMDRPMVSAGLKLARAVASDLPCLLVQRMARLRMIDELQTEFLHYSMQTQAFITQLLGDQTGTQLPHISGSGIEEFVTPLPPLLEQQQIVSNVAETLSQVGVAEVVIEHGLLRAARLRQSILKQAFEGKLVPQDPRDEPASVLLERIGNQNQAMDRKPGKRVQTTGSLKKT